MEHRVEIRRKEFGQRWMVTWNLHTVWGNFLPLVLLRAWRGWRKDNDPVEARRSRSLQPDVGREDRT